jgi:transcriptional regulator with XRE-family HTH domain
MVEFNLGLLAKRVAVRRQSLGWTQQRLSQEAGVPIGTLRDTEQGRREPRIGAVWRLARALGASLDELAGNEARCDQGVN